MDDMALRIRYMAAHVRLHSKAEPGGWSLQDLVDSFLLLPAPAVLFEAWNAAVNPESGEDAAARANRNALAVIESHNAVKVT